MVASDSVLRHRESLQVESFCFGVAALGDFAPGELVDVVAWVGMQADGDLVELGKEANDLRPLDQGGGLGIAVLGAVKFGKIFETTTDVGMVGSQRLFCDRKRPLQEGFRVAVAALRAVDLTKPGN